MKPSILLGLVLFVCPAFAQSPQRTDAGGYVFRLQAPAAEQVTLQGQWTKEPIALQREPNDAKVWTVTIDTIPAGVWEYGFSVDGLSMLDPGNPDFKPQREPRRSILHVPATPLSAWDFQDVPHGTVHHHTYLSKTLDRPRAMVVYTPPGYEESSQQRYPLLVLQHGSGDNQATWVAHGKAHWILDALIHAGQTKPMIVVMIDGHPMGQVARNDDAARDQSLKAFQDELFNDALPLVESKYRVSDRREDRALAGLSMGGWQAIHVGLANVDRFAWLGSFSGAADVDKLQGPLANAESLNQNLKLLWIACGRDDFLLSRNEALHNELTKQNVRHQYELTAGDHSWPVWRTYLSQFAPKLFQ